MSAITRRLLSQWLPSSAAVEASIVSRHSRHSHLPFVARPSSAVNRVITPSCPPLIVSHQSPLLCMTPFALHQPISFRMFRPAGAFVVCGKAAFLKWTIRHWAAWSDRSKTSRKKRRLRAGDGNGWSKLGMLTAVLIGVLLNCDFRPAAHWLLRNKKHRRKYIEAANEGVLTAALEELFLSMSVEALLALQDEEDSPLTARQLAAARTAANEYTLAEWVRFKNLEFGTPVRTATMARKLRELAGAVHDMDPRVVNMANPNCIKCWGYQWRRRNGGKIGMLRKSEPAARDEALYKASPSLVAPHMPVTPFPASPPTGLPLPSP